MDELYSNSYPLVSVTVVLSKQDILLLDVNSEFHFQINIIDMLEILKDGLDALQGSWQIFSLLQNMINDMYSHGL